MGRVGCEFQHIKRTTLRFAQINPEIYGEMWTCTIELWFSSSPCKIIGMWSGFIYSSGFQRQRVIYIIYTGLVFVAIPMFRPLCLPLFKRSYHLIFLCRNTRPKTSWLYQDIGQFPEKYKEHLSVYFGIAERQDTSRQGNWILQTVKDVSY